MAGVAHGTMNPERGETGSPMVVPGYGLQRRLLPRQRSGALQMRELRLTVCPPRVRERPSTRTRCGKSRGPSLFRVAGALGAELVRVSPQGPGPLWLPHFRAATWIDTQRVNSYLPTRRTAPGPGRQFRHSFWQTRSSSDGGRLAHDLRRKYANAERPAAACAVGPFLSRWEVHSPTVSCLPKTDRRRYRSRTRRRYA